MGASADELLQLMQAGDLRAIDVLARTYGSRLLSVARRQCHVAADAEEAVQHALLTASTSMTQFRGESSPFSWLSTLVARTCGRMNQRAERLTDEADVTCSCAEKDVLLERRIHQALMALSRTDRVAFMLAAEGFTGEEIAERFGVTSNAIRSRLKRVRQQLRDTLADVDGTDRVNLSPGAPDAAHHR